MKTMSVTIKDIARLSGVSTTTVSKVLNGKDFDIGKDTIKRVKIIIEKYNYHPSVIAQSMRTHQTWTIGFLLPDIRNPFYTEVVRGAEDCANIKGYSLLICHTDNKIEKEIDYIRTLEAKHVDGIVLAGLQILERLEARNIKTHLPVSSIANSMLYWEIDENQIPYQKGTQLSTQHLIDLGHQKIVFISGPEDLPYSRRRYQGYRYTLHNNQIELDKKRVKFLNQFDTEMAYQYMIKEFDNMDATAVVCGNDIIAYGVMKAMSLMGYHIPNDVSIVGFDDVYLSEFTNPPLTTIRQSKYELGWLAIQELVNKLEDKNEPVNYEELNVELIVRQTTTKVKE
jgi:LacI family transcriptional regulator